MISSGRSPKDSQFITASANGDDVFFATDASLLPQDPGLYDVYDARVGGGLPEPTQISPCEGEACQGPVSVPEFQTPASSLLQGLGNLKSSKKCAKGKVKKKGKCVKKHKNKKHKKGKQRKKARRLSTRFAERRGAGR